jgi:hypothetical protein
MDWVWVIISFLFVLCLGIAFIKTYNKGFDKGARRVLEEWKRTLDIMEEDTNDK